MRSGRRPRSSTLPHQRRWPKTRPHLPPVICSACGERECPKALAPIGAKEVPQDVLDLVKLPDSEQMQRLRVQMDRVLFNKSLRSRRGVRVARDRALVDKGAAAGGQRGATEGGGSALSAKDRQLIEVREQLDGLVGLDRVKKQFNTLISRAEVDAQRRELGMKLPERDMHLVFAGPPGTGKSTSARILAKAYSAVGLVKNPVPVEVSGRELVSKYAGETAEQTREIFDRAKNGVLFIDEAYAMVTGPHDTHGIEALNEFLKLAEDRRDSTVVILAGYGDEDEQQGVVEYLAQYNPGLRSRFPSR